MNLTIREILQFYSIFHAFIRYWCVALWFHYFKIYKKGPKMSLFELKYPFICPFLEKFRCPFWRTKASSRAEWHNGWLCIPGPPKSFLPSSQRFISDVKPFWLRWYRGSSRCFMVGFASSSRGARELGRWVAWHVWATASLPASPRGGQVLEGTITVW